MPEPAAMGNPAHDLWVEVPLTVALGALPWSRGVGSLAWIALCIVCGVRWLRGEAHPPREVLLGVAGFLVLSLFSIPGSRDRMLSWNAWLGWAGMLAAAVAVAGRRSSGNFLPALELTWIYSALLPGTWFLGESLLQRYWLAPRSFGTWVYPMLGNPRETGQYLLILSLWCFARAITARGRSWPWHAAWALATVLLSSGGTRAAAPGFLLAIGLSSWRARRPIMGVLASGWFLGGSLLLPGSILHRSLNPREFQDGYVAGRIHGWIVAGRMIAERPFTGEGMGTWLLNYGRLRDPSYEYPWYHAHNVYLMLLAEAGILGLAGFVWMIGGFRRAWWGGWRVGPVDGQQLAALGILLALGLLGFLDMTWVGERGFACFALWAWALGRPAALTRSSSR